MTDSRPRVDAAALSTLTMRQCTGLLKPLMKMEDAALFLVPVDAVALKRYRQGVLLGVAYGCSVGGIATLTGTPANIIMAGFVADEFPEYGEVKDP